MPLFYDPQVHNAGGALARGFQEGTNLALSNIQARRQQEQGEREQRRLEMAEESHGQQTKLTGFQLVAAQRAEEEAKKKTELQNEIGTLNKDYEAIVTANDTTPEKNAQALGQLHSKILNAFKNRGFWKEAKEIETTNLNTLLGVFEKGGPAAAKAYLNNNPDPQLSGIIDVAKRKGQVTVKTDDGGVYAIDEDKLAQGLPREQYFIELVPKNPPKEVQPTETGLWYKAAQGDPVAIKALEGIEKERSDKEYAALTKALAVAGVAGGRADARAAATEERQARRDQVDRIKKGYEEKYKEINKAIENEDLVPAGYSPEQWRKLSPEEQQIDIKFERAKLYKKRTELRQAERAEIEAMNRGVETTAPATTAAAKPAGATPPPASSPDPAAARLQKLGYTKVNGKWQAPKTAAAPTAEVKAQSTTPVAAAAASPSGPVVIPRTARPGVVGSMTKTPGAWDFGLASRIWNNSNIPPGYTPEQWKKMTPLQQASARTAAQGRIAPGGRGMGR